MGGRRRSDSKSIPTCFDTPAVRFARCDQLTRGLPPPRRCPCRRTKRKRPGNRGALKFQPVRASGCDLGRLDLQKLTRTRDRDRPRLHRLRYLAHEVDV